jgi:hypothetical protein
MFESDLKSLPPAFKKCVVVNEPPSQKEKYHSRKSPPLPANECPEGMIYDGNDGKPYVVSNPNKKGVKRWIPLVNE